jgi:ABC-type Mn2+/Zn2+ transport system ATPase subunit
MNVIDVEHLRKEYATTVAVDDVSFSVGDSEIFGILGPNGRARRPLSTASRAACAGQRLSIALALNRAGLLP